MLPEETQGHVKQVLMNEGERTLRANLCVDLTDPSCMSFVGESTPMPGMEKDESDSVHDGRSEARKNL